MGVISAPHKLAGRCPWVSHVDRNAWMPEEAHHTLCEMRDGCINTAVVWEYVRRPNRTLSQRPTREHPLSLKNKRNAYLPAHGIACRCDPRLREVKIIGRSNETLVRAIGGV